MNNTKLHLNGLVCEVSTALKNTLNDISKQLESDVDWEYPEQRYNYRQQIINSCQNRCYDTQDIETIQSELKKLNIDDDEIISLSEHILFYVLNELDNYVWHNIKVTIEDIKYIECYFNIYINIPNIITYLKRKDKPND